MDAIEISDLSKTYYGGQEALKNVSLSVKEGEIFGLLGPNGAGKTTLIGIVAGVVRKTSGRSLVFGKDIEKDWRHTRRMIGLVPQELTLNPFDTVWNTLRFQRGFHGNRHDVVLLQSLLRSLTLWDKRNVPIKQLSGGMKRRVLIGKALINEPRILFLDEPSAGVDVELRQGMWDFIGELKSRGTTIILTTHYLEEAEKMADRIGILNSGRLELVAEKNALISQMGEKKIVLRLRDPLKELPPGLEKFHISLSHSGTELEYSHKLSDCHLNEFLDAVRNAGFVIEDLETRQKSLEEIFIHLINRTGSSQAVSEDFAVRKGRV